MISSLDIARICGVSQGTVDRALHNRPGVSSVTKQRIEAVAREHGYRPHPGVRELLTGKSAIIGALVPAMNAVFFMDFMQSVKVACDARSLKIFISPVADREEFLTALDEFAARRMAGVLAVPPCDEIKIPQSITNAMRVATLVSPCANKAVPLFAPDERATGAVATTYLLGLGHHRIVHATYRRRSQAIDDRVRGYEDAMRAAGETPHVLRTLGEQEWRDAFSREQPTAVFCHNDRLAFNLIKHMAARGLKVPDDVSIMGVDNSPTITEFNAELTTMTYPCDEIASKAIRWLVDGVDERPITPMVIVERATTRRLA